MPRGKSRPPRKVSARARQTRIQQSEAARRRSSARTLRFRRSAGWTLCAAGVLIGASHLLAHMGVWSFASPGVMDLLAGYPVAALLVLLGVITLSKSP